MSEIPTDSYLVGQLTGFSVGVAISVLLSWLTWRAVNVPGTPKANILFSLCALAWNFGGFAYVTALLFGIHKEGRPAAIAAAIQFSAAAIWPISALSIWRTLARREWQRNVFQILLTVAFLSAGLTVLALWATALWQISLFRFGALWKFTAYNGAILLFLGVAILLPTRPSHRGPRLYSVVMSAGLISTITAILALNYFHFPETVGAVLVFLRQQSPLLIVFGAFCLFSRFRFADLFIRYSLRLTLTFICATAIALVARSTVLWTVANRTAFPAATQQFSVILAAGVLTLSFWSIAPFLEDLVNRRLLRHPDFRIATRQLAAKLACQHTDELVLVQAGTAIQRVLEVESARVIPTGGLPDSWRAGLPDEEFDGTDAILELPLSCDVEVLIPVRTGGTLTHLLGVAPGPFRRGLVSGELSYLRTVALLVGNRLDSLRWEREAVERQTRETTLSRHVTEAELRALRAQINPHFLFNSFNTIADLIVRAPEKAEIITLRLAKVFRYVLAQSFRPITPLGEEIDFLRSYLAIEEVRFGDRLHVRIAAAPRLMLEPVPSLILQPIVENALMHGLAPKPGAVHLWISASACGDRIRLTVEDDGLGPPTTRNAENNGGFILASMETTPKPTAGVGLTNIAQRLMMLYQDQASLSFEARPDGGSRVTILLPRSAPSE